MLSDVLELRYIPKEQDNAITASNEGNDTQKEENQNLLNDHDAYEIYERHLSQAMIPGEHLVKVEMNKDTFEGIIGK